MWTINEFMTFIKIHHYKCRIINRRAPIKIVVIPLIFQNRIYLEHIQNNNHLRLLFCFCIYVCISFRVIYYIIYTRVCVFFFVFCVILFEQFGTLFSLCTRLCWRLYYWLQFGLLHNTKCYYNMALKCVYRKFIILQSVWSKSQVLV